MFPYDFIAFLSTAILFAPFFGTASYVFFVHRATQTYHRHSEHYIALHCSSLSRVSVWTQVVWSAVTFFSAVGKAQFFFCVSEHAGAASVQNPMILQFFLYSYSFFYDFIAFLSTAIFLHLFLGRPHVDIAICSRYHCKS